MRKLISSILALVLTCSMFAGVASAEEPPADKPEEPALKEIALQYDDRYTFKDAKVIEVESGNPVIEVTGNTIRAAGITEAPVTVTVDGEEYLVSVDKAAVEIFVIDGQSNAWGAAGRHDKNAVVPDSGCGYYWSNGTLNDAREYVKAVEKLLPRASVGVWPALAAEWYALTGEKAVVMNLAQSGAPIQSWTSGYYQTGVQLIEQCIDSIDTDLFTVAGGGFFWFQGESNADIYEITYQMRYTDPEEYVTEFNIIQDAYTSAFASRGIEAFAGIFSIRTWGNLLGVSRLNDYCGARAAHQFLANRGSNVFIVSSLTESWEKSGNKPFSYTSEAGTEVKISSVRALFSGVHYNQSGYDIMGLEAADSLYSGWFCGNHADDFVLYGQDAKTIYEEESVIYLDDNLRITGAANRREKYAAQLVAVTLPRGDACSDLQMRLTRSSDGSDVSDIMTETGYIPDVSLLDEDMILTVSMGELSKSYTLSKHAHKLAKGAESKKGSFEFTDRNGDVIDGAGLGDTVYVASMAEEDCIPVGLSVYETVSGKTISYNDEEITGEAAVYSFRMPAVDVSVKGKYLKPGTDNIGYRFTVTYDKNAEEASGSMRRMSGSIGQKSALAANCFEYEGHTFSGWNTSPDGSGTAIEDCAKISDFVFYNNSSITLYAQWDEDMAEPEEPTEIEFAADSDADDTGP